MINHQDFYDALELSPTNQEKEEPEAESVDETNG
jgi:hypothetical protein